MQEAGETAKTSSILKKIVKLAIKKLPESFFIDKEDLDLEPELYDLAKLQRRCVERIGVVRKQQVGKTPIKRKDITARLQDGIIQRQENIQQDTPQQLAGVRRYAAPQQRVWSGAAQNQRVYQQQDQQKPVQRQFQQLQQQQIPQQQRQRRMRVCWNCDQPGHHWMYCNRPIDTEKIKQAKERLEQDKMANTRVRYINSFPKNVPKPAAKEGMSNSEKDMPERTTNTQSEEIKDAWVHRLKSGTNQGYQEVVIEVYSESHAQFVTVPGVLDSGTRLNVAPIDMFKYCVEELPMSQEKFFCTPTGQLISAEKYGILKLRLKTQQGQLSLGTCRVFFMGGTWRELLIVDNTLKHLGTSPKTAVMEKIQEAQKGNDK